MAASRHKLREHLFRMVFLTAFNKDEEIPEQIDLYLEDPSSFNDDETDAPLSDQEKSDLRERFCALKEVLPSIDERLNTVSHGWKTQRMAKVDLAILRLGVYELVYDNKIPTGVAISEAVELAKQFGGEESSSFVNGILGHIAKE